MNTKNNCRFLICASAERHEKVIMLDMGMSSLHCSYHTWLIKEDML